ncbi:MAG: hypothetical protein WDM86_12390 [Rhizomicrobium sp.]
MIRAAIAVAAWLAATGFASAHAEHPAPQIEATGRPTPIGHVSRDVSPVGFTYTEARAGFGVPAAPMRRGRHLLHHAAPPRKSAPRPRLTASAH